MAPTQIERLTTAQHHQGSNNNLEQQLILHTNGPATQRLLPDLPTELLLHICDFIQGPNRNTNLASLALVSRRLRPVAQEQLLCRPSFKLTHIHTFLRELGHHHTLIPKIKRLEIFSSTTGRIQELPPPPEDDSDEAQDAYFESLPDFEYPALPCPREVFMEPGFRARCTDVINYFLNDEQEDIKKDWLAALNSDIVPALLGVLLVLLPNLKELHIATSWLMDWPIFSSLRASELRDWEPWGWEHTWMDPIMEHVQGRLEVLEFPADLTELRFPWDTKSMFDLRIFNNLRRLSLTMPMLLLNPTTRVPDLLGPADILPASLELLQVGECNCFAGNMLNDICLAKKRHELPRLARVEFYHEKTWLVTSAFAKYSRALNLYQDVVRICSEAEIEIYQWFPQIGFQISKIGATPWKLREEGARSIMRAEFEYNKRLGWEEELLRGFPFTASEMHADASGDLVMREGDDHHMLQRGM